MAHTKHIAALLLAVLASFTFAQQGVLTNGNSQLPACAQSCNVLIQAAAACGGQTSGSQSAWICFCQSAYLTGLFTSDTNVCDSYCSGADSQQVSTWYKSNCGTDHGASEHADSGAASSSAAGSPASTSSAGAVASTPAATGSSSSSNGGATSSTQNGDWWSTHYKWVIMLIVLAIMLPLIGVLMTLLKRRHDRKQDQIIGGFNAGITTRSAGGPGDAPMSNRNFNGSGPVANTIDGSRSNSPARTREAFMPYGYAYSRSQSRVGSRQAVNEQHRGSPLAKTENEKGAVDAQEPGKKKSRRVLVRERSANDGDDIEMEKGPI